MDWLINIISKPDFWSVIFAGLGTAGAAAGVYLAKKLGLKLAFKPTQATIGPTEIAEIIEKKLKEVAQIKDYEDLKTNHFQLQALFKVSESQWEEKIAELKIEIEQLKADKAKLER